MYQSASGAVTHRKNCNSQFPWAHPKTLALLLSMHETKVCQGLDTNKIKNKMAMIKAVEQRK